VSAKQGGAGGHKHGRNAKKCLRYKSEGRRAKNKVKRAAKRAKQMP